MRIPDPIADNQTDQTIIALTNGNADDKTRDHATAALLASVQKLIVKTEEIERNLWKPSDLERVIDDRHRLVCQACPIRKYAESVMTAKPVQAATPVPVAASVPTESTQTKDKFSDLLSSLIKNPLGICIAIVCLGLMAAVVYLATGKDGFHEITNAAHLTNDKHYPQYPADARWWTPQEVQNKEEINK